MSGTIWVVEVRESGKGKRWAPMSAHAAAKDAEKAGNELHDAFGLDGIRLRKYVFAGRECSWCGVAP